VSQVAPAETLPLPAGTESGYIGLRTLHLEAAMEMVTDPRQKIEDVLESIRPALRSDGGDVELIDFDEDDGIVQVRLVGACGTCPISTMTLKQGIERRIMMAVPEVRGILAL
jgi:Fe-S cluster biogenesis protein NfuA